MTDLRKRIKIEQVSIYLTARLEADPFHVWNDGGVHEMVSEGFVSKGTRALLRADLLDRAKHGQSRCETPDCEWCEDTRNEQKSS